MPKYHKSVAVFMELTTQLYPELASRLEAENVMPTMYAFPWFFTMFTSIFPIETASRIWDIFILEGWEIIFRVSLAILEILRAEIMEQEFEGIYKLLKTRPSKIPCNTLIKVALSVPLTKAQIQKARTVGDH